MEENLEHAGLRLGVECLELGVCSAQKTASDPPGLGFQDGVQRRVGAGNGN